MAANTRISYNIGLKVDNTQAKAQMQDLLTIMNKISTMSLDSLDTSSLKEGVQTARQLESVLRKAFNVNTGNLDLSKFSNSLRQAGLSVTDLSAKLNNLGPTGQSAFHQLANSVASAQLPLKQTNSMVDNLLINLKKTAQWQISSSIIHGVVGQVQSAIGYVKNLNKSLTDIAIVSDLSSVQLSKFASDAQKMGQALKTSTLDVTNAALIYFQQGDNVLRSMEKAAITIKAANASANSSAAEMSEYLTAIWNSYQVGSEDLEKYVDVMASLGAKTASSMEEIATAMQKVAATANTVGVGFDQMSSIISTVSSVTRESAESIGTSYKTILARIGDLKIGDLVEDGATVTLGQVSSQLKDIGINILDAKGDMRDMGAVIEEIGAKWQGMNSAQKAAVAQTIAGKRQYTQLMALFENWDSYQKNMIITEDSSGALNEMQDTWAEGWEAASNKVRNSMEGIYSSLINDKAITGMLNVFAEIINGVNGAIDAMGGFGSAIALVGGILTAKLGNRTHEFVDAIRTNLGLATGEAKRQLVTMQAEFAKVKVTGTEAQQRDITHRNAVLSANARYNANQDKMSMGQREMYQMHLESLKQKQLEENALAEKAKQLRANTEATTQATAENIAQRGTEAAVEESKSIIANLDSQIAMLEARRAELNAKSTEDISEEDIAEDEALTAKQKELEQQKAQAMATARSQVTEKLTAAGVSEDLVATWFDGAADEAAKAGAKIGRALTESLNENIKKNKSLEFTETLRSNAQSAIKTLKADIDKIDSAPFEAGSPEEHNKDQQRREEQKKAKYEAMKMQSQELQRSLTEHSAEDYQQVLSELQAEGMSGITGEAGALELDLSAGASVEAATQLEAVIDAIIAKFTAMQESASEAGAAAEDALSATGEGQQDRARDQANAVMQEQENESERADNDKEQKDLEEQLELDTKPIYTASDAIAGFTGGVMSAYGAVQSLVSVWSTLQDPDATGWEKFSAVLTGMVGVVTGLSGAMSGLNTISMFFQQSAQRRAAASLAEAGGHAANTGALGANTTALGVNQAFSKAWEIAKGNGRKSIFKFIGALFGDIGALTADTAATGAATTATIALQLAKLGLVGAIIAAGAALVAGAVALVNWAASAHKTSAELDAEMAELAEHSAALEAQQKQNMNTMVSLATVVADTSGTIEEQTARINELTSAYGIQASALDVLNGKYGKLNEQIVSQMKAEQDAITAEQEAIAAKQAKTGIERMNQDINETGWQALRNNFGDEWSNVGSNVLQNWGKANDLEAQKMEEFFAANADKLSGMNFAWDSNKGRIVSTGDVKTEDYIELYRMLNAAGAQSWGSKDSYIYKMMNQMEDGGWNLDDVVTTENRVRQSKQMSALLGSDSFELLDLDGEKESIEEVSALMAEVGATSIEDQGYLLDYLSQFEHYSEAALQLKGLNEMALSAAKIAGEGVTPEQIQADLMKQISDQGLDLDVVLRVNPTDIILVNGEYVVSELALQVAQAQKDLEEAQAQQEKISSLEDIAEKDTFTREDYEQARNSKLFSEEELNEFTTSSPAARMLMLERKRQEAEEKELAALQTLVEKGQQQVEKYGEAKDEYLAELQSKVMGDGALKDKYGKYSGQELYDKMQADRVLLQNQKTYKQTYGSITDFKKIEDQEAYRAAALAAMSAEERATYKTKTTEEIFNARGTWGADIGTVAQITTEMESLNAVLLEGETVIGAYSDAQAELAEAQGDLDTAEWWRNTGKAIEEATKGAEAFGKAMLQQDNISQETLATLMLLDEHAFANYQNMNSDEWAHYAYEKSMEYYDLLLARYDKDSMDYALVMQQKQQVTESFYEQQAQEAEQALDKLSDKYNEFIGNVDDARSVIEKLLSGDMSFGDLGFEQIEKLKQSLRELGYDSEQVNRILQNLGKDQDLDDRESVVATMRTDVELLLDGIAATKSYQNAQYGGLVSTITVNAQGGTNIGEDYVVDKPGDPENPATATVNATGGANFDGTNYRVALPGSPTGTVDASVKPVGTGKLSADMSTLTLSGVTSEGGVASFGVSLTATSTTGEQSDAGYLSYSSETGLSYVGNTNVGSVFFGAALAPDSTEFTYSEGVLSLKSTIKLANGQTMDVVATIASGAKAGELAYDPKTGFSFIGNTPQGPAVLCKFQPSEEGSVLTKDGSGNWTLAGMTEDGIPIKLSYNEDELPDFFKNLTSLTEDHPLVAEGKIKLEDGISMSEIVLYYNWQLGTDSTDPLANLPTDEKKPQNLYYNAIVQPSPSPTLANPGEATPTPPPNNNNNNGIDVLTTAAPPNTEDKQDTETQDYFNRGRRGTAVAANPSEASSLLSYADAIYKRPDGIPHMLVTKYHGQNTDNGTGSMDWQIANIFEEYAELDPSIEIDWDKWWADQAANVSKATGVEVTVEELQMSLAIKLGQALANGDLEGEAYIAGMNLFLGLTNGWDAGDVAAFESKSGLVLETIKSGLKEASPSKATMQMGKDLMAGLNIGWNGAEFEVGNLQGKVLDAIQNELKGIDRLDIGNIPIEYETVTEGEGDNATETTKVVKTVAQADDKTRALWMNDLQTAPGVYDPKRMQLRYMEAKVRGTNGFTPTQFNKDGTFKIIDEAGTTGFIQEAFGGTLSTKDTGKGTKYVMTVQLDDESFETIEFDSLSDAYAAALGESFSEIQIKDYLVSTDRDNLTDIQDAIVNQAVQEYLAENKYSNIEEAIAAVGIDNVLAGVQGKIDSGYLALEDYANVSWAQIKDRWIEGAQSVLEMEQTAAQEYYDLWVDTFEAIVDARKTIFEGGNLGTELDKDTISTLVYDMIMSSGKTPQTGDKAEGYYFNPNEAINKFFKEGKDGYTAADFALPMYQSGKMAGLEQYLDYNGEFLSSEQSFDRFKTNVTTDSNSFFTQFMNEDALAPYLAVLTAGSFDKMDKDTAAKYGITKDNWEDNMTLAQLFSTLGVLQYNTNDKEYKIVIPNDLTEAWKDNAEADKVLRSMWAKSIGTQAGKEYDYRQTIYEDQSSKYNAAKAQAEEDQKLVQKAMSQGWEALSETETKRLQEIMQKGGWETLGEANLGLANAAAEAEAGLRRLAGALGDGYITDGSGKWFKSADVQEGSYKDGIVPYDSYEAAYEANADTANFGTLQVAEQNTDGTVKTYSMSTIAQNDDGKYYLRTDVIPASAVMTEGSDAWNKYATADDTYVTEASSYNIDNYASKANMEVDEFKTYANTVNQARDNPFDISTTEGQEELYNFAKKLAMIEEGYKELSEVSDDTWATLKDGSKKGTREYAKALSSMKKTMQKLFPDNEGLIDDAFVEQYKEQLEKMANGTEEEIAVAREAIQTGLLEKWAKLNKMDLNKTVTVTVEGQEDFTTSFNMIEGMLDQWDNEANKVITVDADVSSAEGKVMSALNAMLSAGVMTATQIEGALNSIGWDPQITWEPVTVTNENAQSLHGYAKVGDTYEPIEGEMTEYVGQTVYIPHINSVSNTGGPPPAPSPSGGGGGGGNKKPPKPKDPLKREDETERYRDISEELARTSEALEKIQKQKERAFGKKYLDQLDAETDKLRENIDEQERYLDEIRDWVEKDQQALIDLGIGAEFDAEGNLSNYDEVMENLMNRMDGWTEEYNRRKLEIFNSNMSDEEKEEANEALDDWYEDREEAYDDAKEAIDQYSESLALLGEEEAQLLELQNKLSEATLEKITYKVEIVTEINDKDVEILEYYQKLYEDNLDSQGKLMRNLTQQAQEYESNMAVITTAMAELKAEYDNGNGPLNEADFVEGMQQLQDQALSYANSLEDLKDQIVDVYSNTLDMAREEIQNYTDVLQESSDAMSTFISIMGLLGHGVDYRSLEKFYKAQYESNVLLLENQRKQLEELKKKERYFERQKALNGELTEVEQEQYKALQLAIRETNAELISSTEAALSALQEGYQNTISAIFKELDASIAGTAGTIAELADEYAYYQEEQERYVSTAKELYEVSKLNRSIEQSLQDATTSASKAKLKALQDEINLISEKNDLSEYDIEMMNLQYKLTLAQIALEEAQASKDTVRLTRDQDGNMAYQYTANQEKVHEAQQQYEDVLQEINDLGANRISELEQSYLTAQQDYIAAAAEIWADTQMSDEERTRRLTELSRRYSETLLYIQEQYTNASNALTVNQQTISEHYGQALVNSMGYASTQLNSTLQQMIDNPEAYIQQLNETIFGTSMDALSEYLAGVQGITDAAGLVFDESGIMDILDAYTDANEEAAASANAAIDAMGDALTDVNAATQEWDAHLATLENVQNAYVGIAEAIQQTITAMSGFQEYFGSENNPANSNPEDTAVPEGSFARPPVTVEGLMLEEAYLDAISEISDLTNHIIEVQASAQVSDEQITELMNAYHGNLEQVLMDTTLTMEEREKRLTETTEYYEAQLNELENLYTLQEELLESQNIWHEHPNWSTEEYDAIMGYINADIENFFSFQDNVLKAIGSVTAAIETQTMEQFVEIKADFPNVTNQDEIKEAFNELIILASQHANSSNGRISGQYAGGGGGHY